MRKSKWYCPLAAGISLGVLFSCSKFIDDSTDLGGNVIEDIYPDKVTLNKHFREYVMDSSALVSASSLPAPGDRMFGVHAATGSKMVMGIKDDERAAGYVQFVCTPDTGSTRRNAPNDTLKEVIIRFVRDTNFPSVCRIAAWYSNDRSHALNPTSSDVALDTMSFLDTAHSNLKDSIFHLPDSLTAMIFKACTTSNRDSARAHYVRDTFGFILSVISCDSLVRLNGNPQMAIRFRRGGTDSTDKYVTYGSLNVSYYYGEDITADSLDTIPALRYASKRTAVFHYDAVKLWETTSDMADPRRALFVSAIFSLQGPKAGDTLNVRYLLWHKLESDGTVLDSLFAGKNPQSPPGTVTIQGAARTLVNLCPTLRWYEQNDPSPVLYLYLRFNEDINQVWKKARWNTVPLLTAMISVP